MAVLLNYCWTRDQRPNKRRKSQRLSDPKEITRWHRKSSVRRVLKASKAGSSSWILATFSILKLRPKKLLKIFLKKNYMTNNTTKSSSPKKVSISSHKSLSNFLTRSQSAQSSTLLIWGRRKLLASTLSKWLPRQRVGASKLVSKISVGTLNVGNSLASEELGTSPTCLKQSTRTSTHRPPRQPRPGPRGTESCSRASWRQVRARAASRQGLRRNRRLSDTRTSISAAYFHQVGKLLPVAPH